MKLFRSRALWVAILMIVLLLAVFRPGAEPEESSLSLTSTAGDGTKAMVLLLERFGTKVVTQPLPPKGGTALLLKDELGLAQTSQVEAWVNDGGTLIVSDPNSSLTTTDLYEGRPRSVPETLTPDCRSPFAAGVERIDPYRNGRFNVPPLTYERSPQGEFCFLVDGGYFLSSRAQGKGRVVALSSPAIFTNDRLGVVDNAVLVNNLLQSPSGELTVITPRPVGESSNESGPGGPGGPGSGEGEEGGTAGEGSGLSDLISDRFINAALQLLIAGILFMLWRGRRLGRPMEEPLPVEVPASALTAALAHLLQTAGRSTGAAHVLRARLRRDIATLLGLRPDTDPRVLAEVAAERTHIDRARLQYLLTDGPPLDSEALLRLAQELELLHQEVANVR